MKSLSRSRKILFLKNGERKRELKKRRREERKTKEERERESIISKYPVWLKVYINLKIL